MTPVDVDAAPLDLRIVSKGASPAEIAAVTAVVQGALAELADDMAVEGEVRVSAWQRSQRTVRSTLVPGAGRWRDFSG